MGQQAGTLQGRRGCARGCTAENSSTLRHEVYSIGDRPHHSWFPKIFDIVALDLSSCQLGNRVHRKRQLPPKCLLYHGNLCHRLHRQKPGETCPMVRRDHCAKGLLVGSEQLHLANPHVGCAPHVKRLFGLPYNLDHPISGSYLRLYGWATYGRFSPLHGSALSTDAKPSTTRLNGRCQ